MSKPIKKSQPKPRLEPIEFFDDQTAHLTIVLPFSEIQILLGSRVPFLIKPDDLVKALERTIKDPKTSSAAKSVARQLFNWNGKFIYL